MKKIILLLSVISFSWVAKSQQENLQELLNRKQYDQIVLYANQFQFPDSSDFQTMYSIGLAYEGLLKYHDAYRFYQYCLSLDSTQVDLLYAAARMAANLGKTEDAENHFLTIWESDSTNFYANYQLARFYVQSEDDEQAIVYYEYLLERDPNNPILLKTIGDCYYRLNDRFSAAEAYWFAFQNNKENAGLASTLVNTLLPLPLDDVLENALEVCDTALIYNPENKKIIQNKGTVLFTAKRYMEADSVFSVLLEQGDSSYYNLKYGGFSKYYASKYMDSIEPLEKALLEDETAIDVCLFLGSALGRTYDRKSAYKLFDRAEELMQLNPAYLHLLTEFRGTTFYRDGRFNEASVLLYPLWQMNKRSDLLDIIWYCHGNTNVNNIKDDAERERSMFVNVLWATEFERSPNDSKTERQKFVREQLGRFKEEMFFRGMKDYQMIAPDNKKSVILAARLDELIQCLQ